MIPETPEPPSSSPSPTRLFQSMIAAETAYREQVALNETFCAKIDNLGTSLSNALGVKLDIMTDLLERFLNKLGDSAGHFSSVR
jgi:hypothetical protein